MGPYGLPPGKAIYSTLILSIRQLCYDKYLYDRPRQLVSHAYGENWRLSVEGCDPSYRLASECSASGMAVHPSSIKHPKAVSVLFTMRSILVGHILFYHSETLVWYNLDGNAQVHWTYGDGVMGVTVSAFESWSLNFDQKGNGRDGSSNDVWVLPAPWCAGRFIKDNRYFPGDSATLAGRASNWISANSQNVMVNNNHEIRYFKSYSAMTVVESDNIPAGSETVVWYGLNYRFVKTW